MLVGAWLGGQPSLSGIAAAIAIYAVYLLIGIVLGSTANPRFTKAKNKWVYIIPILIFTVIGALSFLSPWLHPAAWPFGIGSYLMQYSSLSWTASGFFLSIALR
jgi:hypothetical protein